MRSRSCRPPFCELGLLGRSLERERRALVAGHRLDNAIEVAGPDLALMAGRAVALALELELALLESHVCRHPLLGVAAGELEHGRVQRVEAGQGDELIPVAELAQALPEAGDLVGAEVSLP